MYKKLKTEILVFLVIILVASFFRLYKIDSVPPGLYPDEAMNGNNALESLSTGQFKVFYPENNGREGFFINIQAISIKVFGNHPWSLRIVSAIIGIFTVAGLYLLTKELMGWRVAALSSFLMAISSWHVIFSRIGFRAIMLPFILVYGFYFFWKGLKQSNFTYFGVAGFFFGLGFHTYISYRVAPAILIVVLLAYWLATRKDFAFTKYNYVKDRLFLGVTVFVATAGITALPLIAYFLVNPQDFFSRTGANLSVFSQDAPIKQLALSVIKTLGMFNFVGDYNWRHNISSWPQLSLPIGILFFLGFFRELVHFFRRKHGHISTVHIFFFSWFFIMLLPGFLSIEAPHALRTIGVIPVVMIFAGLGLFWLFEKLYRWYLIADPLSNAERTHFLVIVTLVVFLTSVGLLEYRRYFIVWATNPQTIGAFNNNYVQLSEKLNNLPPVLNNAKKYIVVNTGGTLVNEIPMPSQTVMFLTDTYTLEKQELKNLYYLTQEQCDARNYDQDSILIPLEGPNILTK